MKGRGPRGEPLFFAPVSWATEQHRRANELAVPLLGPGAQEFALLSIPGRLDVAAWICPVLHRIALSLVSEWYQEATADPSKLDLTSGLSVLSPFPEREGTPHAETDEALG